MGKLGSRGHFWTAWELGSPSQTPNPLCPGPPHPAPAAQPCPAPGWSRPRCYMGETHRSPLPPRKASPFAQDRTKPRLAAREGWAGQRGRPQSSHQPRLGLESSTSCAFALPSAQTGSLLSSGAASACGVRPLTAPGAPQGHKGRASRSPSSLLF